MDTFNSFLTADVKKGFDEILRDPSTLETLPNSNKGNISSAIFREPISVASNKTN